MSNFGLKKPGVLFKAFFHDTSGLGGITGMSVTTYLDTGAAPASQEWASLTPLVAGKDWSVEITPIAALQGRIIRWAFTDAESNPVVMDDYFRVTDSLEDDIKTETASIQSDTNSIESKVDIIDTNVDSILVDTDTTIPALIAAVPTVEEIDTELSDVHGAGAWGGASGTGVYTVTINVQADSSDVADASITVHNSSNDDSPFSGVLVTDTNGNAVFSLDIGTYYVRTRKAAYTFSDTQIVVSASSTKNVTGTANAIGTPADAELCRLYIYPITLDNQDVANLKIHIKSDSVLTKVNGEFISNTSSEFTYDDGTTPDSYYFDALQTAVVHIKCIELGLDHDITVPAEDSKDLDDLIS